MLVKSNEKLATPQQVRAFYDRLGRVLDTQRFFKEPALDALRKYSDFEIARSVYEFGCGTGRLGEQILLKNNSLVYLASDLSSTMVRLTQQRLQRFGSRARVTLSDGTLSVPLPDASADRFVSTYVFDLLPAADIKTMLNEAHRVLEAGGRVCLVSLTDSSRGFGRFITSMWSTVHKISPILMGGCRPIELVDFIDQERWRIQHLDRIARFGLTSELVVAEKKRD